MPSSLPPWTLTLVTETPHDGAPRCHLEALHRDGRRFAHYKDFPEAETAQAERFRERVQAAVDREAFRPFANVYWLELEPVAGSSMAALRTLVRELRDVYAV